MAVQRKAPAFWSLTLPKARWKEWIKSHGRGGGRVVYGWFAKTPWWQLSDTYHWYFVSGEEPRALPKVIQKACARPRAGRDLRTRLLCHNFGRVYETKKLHSEPVISGVQLEEGGNYNTGQMTEKKTKSQLTGHTKGLLGMHWSYCVFSPYFSSIEIAQSIS